MFELLTLDYDFRLQSYCAFAKCDYSWFLAATGGAERNLEIQREIIKGSKAYQTLRADLKRGCLLPPLVLAVKNLTLPAELLQPPSAGLWSAGIDLILKQLAGSLVGIEPRDVYIIDGLQRTNAIKQTLDEVRGTIEEAQFVARAARVEIWLNIPFGALAYRMLLLNAGQRPMSIKHQVEILSMKLQEELRVIPGLEILSSIEADRRTRQGQFHLSKLSQAFQAWLQGTPNIDLRNLVMEQMLVESAIETLGSSLAGQRNQTERDEFKAFVEWVVTADRALPPEVNFFANETVLQGIAAAVGTAERNTLLRDRMKRAMTALLSALGSSPSSDPLGLSAFESLRKGIDPAKVNVGQATREMVFKAFQEHFVSDGLKSMAECWNFAAGTV
jgi:hypothetical protein